MSTKKYVDGLIDSLNAESQKKTKDLKVKEIAHQMGAIFTGAIGFFTLFGMPLMGIPLLGLAGGLALNRKKIMANENAEISRLKGESNHLSNILKKGLKVGDSVNKQRKAEIDKLNKERMAEEKSIVNTESASNFANMVIAGGAAATWIFASTGLGIIPLIGVGIKYIADKKNTEIRKKNSETRMKLNNLINEYNLNIRLSKKRTNTSQQQANTNGNTKGNAKSTQRTTQRTTQQQTTPNSRVNNTGSYSKSDLDAVEEYMRRMEQSTAQKDSYQKRKI